ncbi:MAG: hypothetical protein ABIZ91_09220, partial [Gemmatimonadaceae bacterium]
QIVDSARLRRLPTAPLVNRALQGAARKVPGPRVVALVRAHADSMWAAREALGADAGPDEIDAGGSALRAGASRASLRSLRSARPSGTAITALVVLTDLLSRGVAPVDAASAVTSLASRSTDAALLMFQGALTRDGTPESRERLQAMVEGVVRQIPRQPDAPARMPDEVPAPSLRGAGSAGAQSANESAPSAGHPARR